MSASTHSSPPLRRTMMYNRLDSCPDMEPAFVRLYEQARAYTMTSLERMYGLYKAAEYVAHHDIPGDIVECGVWKGGSAMLCALTLMQLQQTDHRIWLYDTYAGMTPPSDADVQYDGQHAQQRLVQSGLQSPSQWCAASLDEVKRNMASTGYPGDHLRYVVGPVEQTLPESMPGRIALLRLDTDWYESTRHELQCLYPRLSSGGVLIIDDYGHWRGARQAVDEYFAQHRTPILLHRLDYTGRIGVKP